MIGLNSIKHISKYSWYYMDELELVSGIFSQGERR